MSSLDRFRSIEQGRPTTDQGATDEPVPLHGPATLGARFGGMQAATAAPVALDAAPAGADPFAAPDEATLNIALELAEAVPLEGGARRCMHCAHVNARYARVCDGCGGSLEHDAQRRFEAQRARDDAAATVKADAERAAQRQQAMREFQARQREIADAKLATSLAAIDGRPAAEHAEALRARPMDDAVDGAETITVDRFGRRGLRPPVAQAPAAPTTATLARWTRIGPLATASPLGRWATLSVSATIAVALLGVLGPFTIAVQVLLVLLMIGLWQRRLEP